MSACSAGQPGIVEELAPRLAAPCGNVAASDGDVAFPEVGSVACCCAMDEGEELAVAALDVTAALLVAAPAAEAVSVTGSVNTPVPVVTLAGGLHRKQLSL